MNKLTIGLLSFVLGASVGLLATRKFLKIKYEKIADAEIDSIRETYAKRMPTPVNNEPEQKEEPSDNPEGSSSFRDYAELLSKEGYVDYAATKSEKPGAVDKPYVIKPEEYGEIDEYETLSYTYYADDVLVDDGGDVIEDVDNAVGKDSLTHFGEYEDDSVYVRNDKWKCDIEILADLRTYKKVVLDKKPR